MSGRLSVLINPATEDALLARKARGVTVTETVRRAVAILDLFDREAQAGSRFRLVGDGPDRELVLFDQGVSDGGPDA
jgi:hypothetical protein